MVGFISFIALRTVRYRCFAPALCTVKSVEQLARVSWHKSNGDDVRRAELNNIFHARAAVGGPAAGRGKPE